MRRSWASSGCQKPSTSSSAVGLACRPSMPQVQASNSSSSVPAAPGQRDEGVGEVGHPRLALVHRLHDLEPRQAGVRQLVVDQVLRDHPDHLAAGGQRGVGDDAHQPDVTAAVDDADAGAGQAGGEGRGGRAVGRRPGLGPGEDGDAHAPTLRRPSGEVSCAFSLRRRGRPARRRRPACRRPRARRSTESMYCSPPAISLTCLERRRRAHLRARPAPATGKRTLFSP